MTLYSEIASTVTDILAEFGKELTVNVTDSVGVVTSVSLYGVISERVKHEFDSSNLLVGDWKILINNSWAPTLGSTCEIIGIGHVLVDFEPIAPGGVVLAYWSWWRKS